MTEAADILFVTTKATDTINALTDIKHIISPQTQIILFQNGMGIHDSVIELFPSNQTYCAVTTEGAFCSQPFHVTHAGKGSTKLGLYSPALDSDLTSAEAIQLLNNPFLDFTLDENIAQALWEKLTFNVAINAYTVIFNCKNGELLHKPPALTRIKNCCNEIAALEIVKRKNLEASQTKSKESYAEELFSAVSQVLRNTSENYSSMYQDIKQKKLTEIDFINGYIISLAQQHNILCEEISQSYFEIKKLEKEQK